MSALSLSYGRKLQTASSLRLSKALPTTNYLMLCQCVCVCVHAHCELLPAALQFSSKEAQHPAANIACCHTYRDTRDTPSHKLSAHTTLKFTGKWCPPPLFLNLQLILISTRWKRFMNKQWCRRSSVSVIIHTHILSGLQYQATLPAHY